MLKFTKSYCADLRCRMSAMEANVMEENKGRGKAPSKTTLNMLFAKAAGRCQLEGCNKSVLFDEITLKTYNKSNVAHIVAASPLGARGDAVRSYEL